MKAPRRITAACAARKKRDSNLFRKLMNRQICRRSQFQFLEEKASDQFRRVCLQGEADTHDPDASKLKLSFLRRRSKIVEIVSTNSVLFALTQVGVCVAFHRVGMQRICFMNVSAEEVVRSLFYNKVNDSIITVSVFKENNFSVLKCRSTPMKYILRGQPQEGFNLFPEESLRWPGFVEFDDVNSKILTYSADNRVYKVWDLINYDLLYNIDSTQISEVKISPGIMLIIGQKDQESMKLPLEILDIKSGQSLKKFQHPIAQDKEIHFIEQFNEKLLIKQGDENLQIYDVRTKKTIEISDTQFLTPSAFIFLYERQLFLTFRGRNVAVWNFSGQMVTRFEDHQLWHQDCNNIYITVAQDLIVSYCRDADNNTGSINVSNILTGQCIAKITGDSSPNSRHALEDVTSLYYNESANEIYTGNRLGVLYCWAN